MKYLAKKIRPAEEDIALRVVIGLLTVAFMTLGIWGWHLVRNDVSVIQLGALFLWVSLALGFALLGNIAGAIRDKS
jgi:hypothetical protein